MIVVKIILWILLAILVIFIIALFIPVFVKVQYTDDISVVVQYLFLKFHVLGDEQEDDVSEDEEESNTDQVDSEKVVYTEVIKEKSTVKSEKTKKSEKPEKSARKRKKQMSPEKKENAALKWIKTTFNEKGLKGLLSAFKEIARLTGTFLKPVFSHIRIKMLDVNVTVASENAADTAVNYGYFCAGMYPALGVILRAVKFDDYNVVIVPDFNKKKSEFDVSAVLCLVPWFAAVGAVKALIEFLILKYKGIL